MKRPARRKRTDQSRLSLERLGLRQLFAGDVAEAVAFSSDPIVNSLVWYPWSTDETGPVDVDQLLSVYRGTAFSSESEPELTRFQSEAEAKNALGELAANYWVGLLGKKIDHDLRRSVGIYPEVWAFDAVARNESLNLVSAAYTNAVSTSAVRADDLALSDDGYLYLSNSGEVNVIDIRDPAQIKSLTTIPKGKGYSSKLFVWGDRLITVEEIYPTYPGGEWPIALIPASQSIVDWRFTFKPEPPKAEVRIYDIEDRTKPTLLSTMQFRGSLVSSQMRDGQLLLTQNSQFKLPDPAVIGTGDNRRFETKEEYVARNRDELLAAYLPTFATVDGSGELPEMQTLGDWRDIAIAGSRFQSGVSVVSIDVGAETPEIKDSEFIAGLETFVCEFGAESIYLQQNVFGVSTTIYRVTQDSDGSIATDSFATVKGNITGHSQMDEYQGALRVVTSSTSFQSDATANVYVLDDTPDGWKIIGSLENFAPQQEVQSVYFDGDQVLVTTGMMQTMRPFDPLHAIDLTDPTHPVELSDIEIPGFTTYLHRVDQNHWIGLGFVLSNNGQQFQISLYDLADPAHPKTVDTWVQPEGDSESTVPVWGWTDQSVTYDAERGILSLGATSYASTPAMMTPVGTKLFKVDLDAADALSELALLEHPEPVIRNLLLDGYVYTISPNAVASRPLSDLSSEPIDLEILKFTRTFANTYIWMRPNETRVVSLFNNWKDELYEILSVETEGSISVTITDDQRLELVSPSKPDPQTVKVRFRTVDGVESTIELTIAVMHDVVVNPVESDATAAASAVLEDNEGRPVSQPAVGDELWVKIRVEDTRIARQGVFAAYFDVRFISQNFEVVGEPEYLGNFQNQRDGTLTSTGYSQLGAFTTSTIPRLDVQSEELVRFKVRITDEGPVRFGLIPSAATGREFLMFGEAGRIQRGNIQITDTSADPTVSVTRTETTSAQDVNQDGIVSALDALLVINLINARSDESSSTPSVMAASARASATDSLFDLNADGIVSALDVLQIINTVNARYDEAAGEGEFTARKKRAPGVLFDESL